MVRLALSVLVLGLLPAAAVADGSAAAPAARLVPPLTLRLGEGLAPPDGRIAVEPRAAQDTTPPPCVADWCQMRVDVPGIGMPRGPASKSELFVALLDRAHIEPLASVAWFFVATGLRMDWSPANADTSFGASAGGWGNVFVRLRLRIDPWNRPTVPVRPKERTRLEREHAAEREHAEREHAVELEHAALRSAGPLEPPHPAEPGPQRPARLRST